MSPPPLPPPPFLLLFLLLLPLPLLTSSTSSSPASGYALHFQGRHDGAAELAAPRTIFSDNNSSTYPTIPDATLGDGTPFTYSYWFRVFTPTSNTGRMVTLGDAGGMFYLQTEVNANPDGSMSARSQINAVDVISTVPNLIFEEEIGAWHHFAVTSDNKAGGANVTIYFDGLPINNVPDYKYSLDFSHIGLLAFGAYAQNTGGFPNLYNNRHLHGSMDEIAFYKRALSPDEILSSYDSSLDTTDPDLFIYYTFEDAYNSTFATNRGSAGSAYDLLLGSSHLGSNLAGPSMGTADPAVGDEICRLKKELLVVYCDSANAPRVVASGLTLQNAPEQHTVAYAVLGGPPISLPLADSPTATITNPPDAGTFTLTSPTLGTYTPPATAAASSTTIALSSSTIRVIFASPPQISDLSYALVEDRNKTIILSTYDPVGLPVTVTILSLPATGTLYECDASDRVVHQILPSELPKRAHGIRLKFEPSRDDETTNTFQYSATNSQDLTSALSTVTISVLKFNDMPFADQQTAILPASANTLDLTIATVDSDTQFVSLFINSLPIQGSLYYSSSTATSQIESFVNLSPPPIEQYGHKILEFSTYWPSGPAKEWHPDRALGLPDAVRTYGDSVLASSYYCRDGCDEVCAYAITTGGFDNTTHDNFDPVNGVTRLLDENDCWDANAHFEEEGYTEFYTMQFEKQVYIKDIEIGEPRGPMSTVAIEAYDYATKTWMVMWSGEADYDKYLFIKNTQQFSVFLPYPLCQPSFKTDIVRIKQDTKTIDDWNEIDYVKLVGSEEASPGALPKASLVYKPPSGGLDCMESFTFSMSDCGGQRTRLSEVQTYKILPAGGATDACQVITEDNDNIVVIVLICIVGFFAVALGLGFMEKRRLRKEKGAAEDDAKREHVRAEEEKNKGDLVLMENFKLKNDVAMMQDYTQAEIKMLEGQIERFTEEMTAAGMGAEGLDKNMARLLIKADELVGKVVIGAGAFGEVYKSEYRGTAVAVKTVKNVDEDNLDRFKREIMLMGGLRHQNVVTMVGCCWEKDLMSLVMEYCEKGMSSDVLKFEGDNLSWDDPLMKWMLDVARGMSYLHSMSYYDCEKKEQIRGIIHRDLKPDNCLVTVTYGIKIADFGEARAAQEEATMTQVGTTIYVAPEVMKGEYYSGQADVYSFAMTVLQFCLKKRKMLEWLKVEYTADTKRLANVSRISHQMLIQGWRPNIEKIEGAPKAVVDLLGMCWEEYADARPTFAEIVEYIQAEVRTEVMGEKGGGTGGKGSRRTSTSGGLAMRIMAAKAQKATMQFDGGGFVEEYKKEIVQLKEEIARLKLLVEQQGGGELPGQA